MYQLYRDRPWLVMGMILSNIVISAWCIYMDPVINNDGVTYLAIAQMVLDGQWLSAFETYSWPFYSFFIALVAKLFFLDIESAAYLLNTFFVTSLTLAFVCIVDELSNNNRRIILIAVVVVLFFPSISKYRSFIIRDFGYLSSYLWSLYFIFRFCSTLDKKHLVGWLFFACISCLFRFEGIAFLLIAPYFLVLFTATRMPHRKKILGALSFCIVVASVALLYWYVNDKYNDMIAIAKLNGDNINSVSDLFYANLAQRFGQDTNFINVFGSTIGDVSYELLRRMAVVYFIFAIFAYVKGMGLQSRLTKRVWQVFIITNLVVLIGFSLYNSFLVSRYTMATALTFLLLAPFAINKLWQALENSNLTREIAIGVAFTVLILASIHGLDVKTNKSHIKQAGLWVKSNAEPGSSVFSNNKLAVHYSGLDPKGTLTQLYSDGQMFNYIHSLKRVHRYDYLLLETGQDNKLQDNFRQTLWYKFGKPVKIVKGEDGSAMFVFKTDHA